MSTASLRKDHDLIQIVVRAIESTTEMLRDGKQIPESILTQVIDFSLNFTDICHHSKEEDSLFPSLEKAGMPTTMGPIAMMLMEHQRSREIAKDMNKHSKEYIKTGDADNLIKTMQQYTQHITEHLWKENNRLFMMADARLQNVSSQVDQQLNEIENAKFEEIGKTRKHYEEIADNLQKHTE